MRKYYLSVIILHFLFPYISFAQNAGDEEYIQFVDGTRKITKLKIYNAEDIRFWADSIWLKAQPAKTAIIFKEVNEVYFSEVITVAGVERRFFLKQILNGTISLYEYKQPESNTRNDYYIKYPSGKLRKITKFNHELIRNNISNDHDSLFKNLKSNPKGSIIQIEPIIRAIKSYNNISELKNNNDSIPQVEKAMNSRRIKVGIRTGIDFLRQVQQYETFNESVSLAAANGISCSFAFELKVRVSKKFNFYPWFGLTSIPSYSRHHNIPFVQAGDTVLIDYLLTGEIGDAKKVHAIRTYDLSNYWQFNYGFKFGYKFKTGSLESNVFAGLQINDLYIPGFVGGYTIERYFKNYSSVRLDLTIRQIYSEKYARFRSFEIFDEYKMRYLFMGIGISYFH